MLEIALLVTQLQNPTLLLITLYFLMLLFGCKSSFSRENTKFDVHLACLRFSIVVCRISNVTLVYYLLSYVLR
uniref:Transmembrane protein n=1 Tax=Medicago truncatula TaxID=3880 RepID=I3S614_MEDTR|nr:unknown [Medicago truncatula]